MSDWVAFWDSNHSIYVSAGHRDLHYLTVARDIAEYVPSPSATVLDYGCGEALHADVIAARAARLILCEAAPGVRARLAARFSDNPRIEIAAADAIGTLAEGSIDLVVVNSVTQYLTGAQLDRLLAAFRRLLRPQQGLLLLGDVIPPDVSALTDTRALLRFAARNGFLLAALGGVLRTLLSDYRRLRSRLGLSRYTQGAMLARLAGAGFSAERAAVNIGHNQARMTFLARPSV
jgi:SAM-dependent methyltransferase